MKFTPIILLPPLLAQVASAVYTGFNHGAFWGNFEQAKTKANFLEGFTLAANLSTPIPFDSARLFTCVQPNTDNSSIVAFDAAVETKTKLLLGFWIDTGTRGNSSDPLVKREMVALEKGFQKHGKALSDLVIGLSVGNEDIYRFHNDDPDSKPSGASAEVVSATVANVKKLIAASSFAEFMKNKPIGHVDTAQYAAQVKGADFFGMTAYPWWNNIGIDLAKDSFLGSLESVKQAAGNTPVWIAEMGWPFQSASTKYPEASARTMQKYWADVGCSVLGKYTTFWFQLLEDSEPDHSDWGLLDKTSKQPRINDLSCPSAFPSASESSRKSSQAPASSAPSPSSTQTPSASAPPSSAPALSVSSANSSQVTTHITSIMKTTIYATPSSPAPSNGSVIYTTTTAYSIVTVTNGIPSPNATTLHRTWCVTEVDVFHDGMPVTVAGGPAGADGKCSSPLPYFGHPYVTSGAIVKPTEVPKNSTWCVTAADVDWNWKPVPVDANPAGSDGKCISATTYYGQPVGNRTSSTGPQSSAVPSSNPPVSPPVPSSLPPAPVTTSAALPLPLPTSATPPPPPPPSISPAPGSTSPATSSAPPAPPASSVHPICSRRSSKQAASAAPQLPPTVSFSMFHPTPTTKAKRMEKLIDARRRRWVW